MNDIWIRRDRQAGRITLQRPDALNALTYEMCLAIEAALDAWRGDDAIALVVLQGDGGRAFCAGGDIAEMYRTGRAGDYAYGQTFWADEYRLNRKIYHYPKPIVSFLQGFTMGGGVGVGCHGSHRVVGESSKIAMPECGIGLVPDVGGSKILAEAPGFVGAYLGMSGARMGPADAIFAGFADLFVLEEEWPEQIETLCQNGSTESLVGGRPQAGVLEGLRDQIDTHFGKADLQSIRGSLQSDASDFAKSSLEALNRNAPLSLAVCLDILRRLKQSDVTIEAALELEYRFTARSMEHGDFLEGIRAQIIDKDRCPKWHYQDEDVPEDVVEQMLAPLDGLTLDLGRKGT